MRIKFTNLTPSQKQQVKNMHRDELEKKELFEHDLNKRTFAINQTNGSVVTHKDF